MIATSKPVRILPQFLYLEPTSVCNLHCKMCYTNVINGSNRRVSDKEQVLDFVQRFVAVAPPPVTVYWCGTGEAFLHPQFPEMVNRLLDAYTDDQLQQIIQTNGTVRRFKEFTSLARLDFRVSIDGTREFHDWHRGPGTYDKSVNFCREAVDLGCKAMTVRTLLTRDNILTLDQLHDELVERVGPNVQLLLTVPYKNDSLRLVRNSALSINQQDIDDATAIGRDEAAQILIERYGGRFELDETPEAVDNYLSLNTYGVHSCCHGIINLGGPELDIQTLQQRLADSEIDCHACAMFPCQ